MSIPVTKSFLPPISEYTAHIQRAYDNQWLTNRGQLLLELEAKLKERLCIEDILITNNGTVPLQIAVKLLGNGGEVITTPFSYVATTAAIVWEGCKPVFVDIHPDYLTIDETKIEAAITSKTTCILATHVFGNPCNIEEISNIAAKHNLKVIYDAAHCFGVQYNGRSIFDYGDISTCSFHATKLFHTGEGGAAFIRDEKLKHTFYYSHNFGHNGPLDFFGLGINAKISELQAAMGLSVLPYVDEINKARKEIVHQYDAMLEFNKIQKLAIRDHTDWNYSYYPIVFAQESDLSDAIAALNNEQIFPRRYFYPSLDTLPYVESEEMPISRSISRRVLCLPLYYGLTPEEVTRISQIINSSLA
jgi:dTDP-4-amino-4,6-dideoxygalactose transaminase